MTSSEVTDTHLFERLVQKIQPGNTLLRAWELKGGISAQVTALEIKQLDATTKKLVVRQHGAIDFNENPQIAADEFRLLNIIHSAGLPAPIPYLVDASGKIFETPCLVIEFVEGETEFTPTDLDDYLRQFAICLSQIHTIDAVKYDLGFLPDVGQLTTAKISNRPAQVDDSLGEGRIRDILEQVFPLEQRNPSVLLHGDFWVGNLLWRDGQLAGVIDWEDAKRGDPLADLANSRLEILWAFGIEAMQQFTAQYQTIMTTLDYTPLPYWELCAALRPMFRIGEWAGNAVKEKVMRERHAWFVEQAIKRLNIS
ncbi:MAG TPA: phosphotransferase [Phototrophicaceae bacterium]|jgi:aminoglycoside phosphotransferase (APT) family kinase protein|nr:phosphotransferase [Phototrophicaceae bacterium]